MMRSLQLILLFLFISFFGLSGQTRWFNPFDEEKSVVQNQAWGDEIGKSFSRLPNRAKEIVRKPVWDLSRNSSGVALHFHSNSSEIIVRYVVSGALSMSHMPATGVSGLDLYAVDSDGLWRRATSKFEFGDTITYSFSDLIDNSYHNKGFEYRLFMPLYNSVEWMEIGVAEDSEFVFIEQLSEKPIVVYGTSIAQGACATRPGMAWTNILSRSLDFPVVNLGFSGNGPLESEMIDLISEIDASIFIFDGLPNMGNLSSEEITNRIIYAITKIRSESEAPILIVEHIGYSNDDMNESSSKNVKRMNDAARSAYDSLMYLAVSEIYYLDKIDMGITHDGYVDNIHPNDLGMELISRAYEKVIRSVMHMPSGKYYTSKAVSQSRELPYYNWKNRFYGIIKDVKEMKPRKVIIGNSIVHYWGGTEQHTNGSKSWAEHMEPNGFYNMGFGWDRVENVLWRVYHGMLDGYDADEVVLMIGTNNLGINSEEDIIGGLKLLLEQIRKRQPNALIKMVSLLPRRGSEQRIIDLNKGIEEMVIQNGYIFIQCGDNLLLENGMVNESLFIDGLHPNEDGYYRISDVLTN